LGLRHGCCRANRLGSEPVRIKTPKCALDQTIRAQSRGNIGTQFRSALRAVWHFSPIRTTILAFRSSGCNLWPLDSLFMAVSRVGTARQINKRKKKIRV